MNTKYINHVFVKPAIYMTFSFLVLTASPFVYATVSPQSSARVQMQTDRMDTVKTKAVQEIDRRIASLNELITRIQAMKRLSDTQKNALVTDAQSQISNLTSLKTKIQADTDAATLKIDRRAIFTQYRIYMLFMPRVRILAAADRMEDIVGDMNQIAATLETKLTEAKNAGKDVTALQTSLTDLKAKLTDAQTQYQNAENAVLSLTPDNGDTAKMQANKTALENARSLIKTGAQDLKTARTDIHTINQGLKSMKLPKSSTTP